MKKQLFTVAFALCLPTISLAATYDDLINSAKMGDTRDVASILQKGAAIESTDIDGNTLLILAARDGHVDLVEYLIKQRARVNAMNSAGDTALKLAAFRGHLNVVEALH